MLKFLNGTTEFHWVGLSETFALVWLPWRVWQDKLFKSFSFHFIYPKYPFKYSNKYLISPGAVLKIFTIIIILLKLKRYHYLQTCCHWLVHKNLFFREILNFSVQSIAWTSLSNLFHGWHLQWGKHFCPNLNLAWVGKRLRFPALVYIVVVNWVGFWKRACQIRWSFIIYRLVYHNCSVKIN